MIADRRPARGQSDGWGFRPTKRTAPFLHGLASPIRALLRAGIAIMRGGLISGGLFSHFPDGFREAML